MYLWVTVRIRSRPPKKAYVVKAVVKINAEIANDFVHINSFQTLTTETIKNLGKAFTSFSELQKIYGLETPEQIKLRLIWNHLQMLAKVTFGDSEENKRLLKMYDARFSACERFRI